MFYRVMLVCQQCGAEFAVVVLFDGKRRDLRGRKRCVDCRPYRALKSPREPVVRATKLLVCAACSKSFPAKQLVDSKIRSLYRRRFCLDCSPFGAHNTSKIPPGVRSTEERDRVRRARRRESFRRSLHKRRRRRKQDLVEMHGGRCVNCGYSSCLEALQFHHLDAATKSFSLANFSGSPRLLIAEAAKCVLLCANCHRLRHVRDEPQRREVELRREKKLRAVASFGGVCFLCKCRYPATVFEFHHVDSKKKDFEIATRGMQRSWPRIAAELAKCVMLCANCHREVHSGIQTLQPAPVAGRELEVVLLVAFGAA